MSDSPQTIDDVGLRCPECEYNLTGLADDICPECGESFDREQLLAELAGAVMPIPIWCRRKEVGSVQAFVSTAIEIWSHPIRFANRFPVNPDTQEANRFAQWSLGAGLGVLLIPITILSIGNLEDFVGGIITLFAVAVGVYLTEWTIAAAVFVPFFRITKVGTPKPWYRQSLALVRMTRSFMILSALGLCTSVAGLILLSDSADIAAISAYVLSAICLFWWISVALIARTYRNDSTNFVLGVIMVPICVIACAALAFVCLGLLAMFFY